MNYVTNNHLKQNWRGSISLRWAYFFSGISP